MEYKKISKIFSYTKKILEVSFFSFILSLSLSNTGVFASPIFPDPLPVSQVSTPSDDIADNSYMYADKDDDEDTKARQAYYIPNADGKTATAYLTGPGRVFSKIEITSDESDASDESAGSGKVLTINKIVLLGANDFSFVVLDSNPTGKIDIEPPHSGTKDSKMDVYVVSSGNFESVLTTLFGDLAKDSKEYTSPSLGGLTFNKTKNPLVIKTEISSDNDIDENESSDSSDSSSDATNSNSDSSTKGNSNSNSGSNYSSSNYTSGSSSTSSSSSKTASSSSKSASTKTFDSSFNPIPLLLLSSGACIVFKKRKN